MNNQQFFNKSVKHLRAQGRKAWGTIPEQGVRSCMYETVAKDGAILMCAVGGVMTKKMRAKIKSINAMHLPLWELHDELPESYATFGDVECWLVDAMQRVHDKLPPSRWERGFKAVAKEYKLEMPQ